MRWKHLDIIIVIFTGGYDNLKQILDTIIEYDVIADSFTQIGTMTQAKGDHATSVVQYGDFYQWCQ